MATIQSADVISPSFSTRSSLRIAQVAPLSESVPPKLYGGTERVVATLTDELVRQGHDVTLFASGDSRTDATLVAPVPRALRLAKSVDPLALHLLLVEQVAQRADEFDIIHFHIAPLHFSIARRLSIPHVTTLHGRLDLPEIVTLYSEFSDLPLISVSDAQRGPIARSELGRHRLSRPAEPRAAVQRGRRWISGVPRPYFAGETRRSRDRHREGVRLSAQDRGQSGSGRSAVLRAAHPSRCWIIRSSSIAARSPRDRRERFSVVRRRCCSRSTGPSRSVW